MTLYDESYYINRATGLGHSVSTIVPLVSELFRPRSVLDVGCAEGTWLAEWMRCVPGCGVLGVDGGWVKPERLKIPLEAYRSIDLNGELPELGRFDLAMNLEVAEHLQEKRSRVFVEWLCQRAPVILFAAAVPGQGGTGHVNEQWPDYWMELFAGCGFQRFDILRKRLWDDDRINWWYRQNIFLFVSKARLESDRELAANLERLDDPPERFVHPGMLSAKMEEFHPRNMPARILMGHTFGALLRAFRRRIRPDRDH